jgi:hypothetical protein
MSKCPQLLITAQIFSNLSKIDPLTFELTHLFFYSDSAEVTTNNDQQLDDSTPVRLSTLLLQEGAAFESIPLSHSTSNCL